MTVKYSLKLYSKSNNTSASFKNVPFLLEFAGKDSTFYLSICTKVILSPYMIS